VERAGAKASRPPFRRSGVFFESRVIPADASGVYRPNPLAPTKLVPGHPGLNGYKMTIKNVDIMIINLVIFVFNFFSFNPLEKRG